MTHAAKLVPVDGTTGMEGPRYPGWEPLPKDQIQETDPEIAKFYERRDAVRMPDWAGALDGIVERIESRLSGNQQIVIGVHATRLDTLSDLRGKGS